MTQLEKDISESDAIDDIDSSTSFLFKDEPKLLSMPAKSLRGYYFDEALYNLPPTYKEGARKVILIRDLFHYDGRESWKAGTKGVIMPLLQRNLADQFEHLEIFYGDYSYWKKSNGYYPCRLDKTYDFFPFYVNKHGKTRPSQYHTYISYFDFEYL